MEKDLDLEYYKIYLTNIVLIFKLEELISNKKITKILNLIQISSNNQIDRISSIIDIIIYNNQSNLLLNYINNKNYKMTDYLEFINDTEIFNKFLTFIYKILSDIKEKIFYHLLNNDISSYEEILNVFTKIQQLLLNCNSHLDFNKIINLFNLLLKRTELKNLILDYDLKFYLKKINNLDYE